MISPLQKRSNVRWLIVAMLFVITSINYGARTTLGITGKDMSFSLNFAPEHLGIIFSSFSVAYVLGQFPGGWLLDKFGSKKVYFGSVLLWSAFICLQGTLSELDKISFLQGHILYIAMGIMFLVGLSESPAFPANSRIIAAWFPAKERGTAAAIFNAAQYFSTAIFAPIMGWLIYNYGWESVYFFMGGLGVIISFVMLKVIYSPKQHPLVNQAELDYIEEGGALVNMDDQATDKKNSGPKLGYIKQLFASRMMVGIYLGQYCINCLTFFFISWFPIYLATERHLDIKSVGFIAAIPAICGFVGGITGGVLSDKLLRVTNSLAIARKTPIIIGMLISMSMIFCNYVDSIYLVIFFMSLAFFGKAVGALGWAVLADTAPKEISGLAGGLFNMCGNLSSIVTPAVIGYIVGHTGKFEWALVFVAAHAFIAIISFLFIAGPIKRLELKK